MREGVLLYNHSGCENRGCEAIVRTTSSLLHQYTKEHIKLASAQSDYDRSIDLPDIDRIVNNTIAPISFQRLINSIGFRLGMSRESELARKYSPVIREGTRSRACFSVGGDTYCYGYQEHMHVINKALKRTDTPLFLWGCSIEPNSLNAQMIRDLGAYDLIIARESISANALQEKRLPVMLWRDPAFDLEPLHTNKACLDLNQETVGLNISPLVLDRIGERNHALNMFVHLIRHILNTTHYSIVLFSHVTWPHDDDSWVVNELKTAFKDDKRVIALSASLGAREIKSSIGRMHLLITARTHASIAGYSMCVPTLVIGYSVKAKGIAKDLFGDEKIHLIDSRVLQSEKELMIAFDALNEREREERAFLRERIPTYIHNHQEFLQKVLYLSGME